MSKVFTLNFWVQSFVSTMMTIFFIYILKIAFSKVNVPVVSDMVESV